MKIFKREEIQNSIDRKKVFTIYGGECAIVQESDGIVLSTLLGSCVTVMLYNNEKKIYGMNHFLLPSSLGVDDSLKYGLFSMEIMINDMLKLGCKKKDLVAKIAGGGNIVESITGDIGDKNISFARDFCKDENIPILSEDVGGDTTRFILLDRNFETYVKYIKRDKRVSEIEKTEINRLSTIAKSKSKHEIFFFD